MAEKYKHYYVSQSLVENWSKDGKHAAWYNPVSKKSSPNGSITKYFHSNLVDIPEQMDAVMDRINLFFSNLIVSFLSRDFEWLKREETLSAREVLIFQFLQTPAGVYVPDTLFKNLNLFSSKAPSRERKELERTDEVKDAFLHMMEYGIEILDMEATLLKAPEKSSFLLGACPTVFINPYFTHTILNKYPDVQPFEVRGSVMVLPLTPDKALCLYDPETYNISREDEELELTTDDIDMLNMAMLYNSCKDGGVIHLSGEEYINKLYNNFDDEDSFREIFFGDFLDEYPFDTKLSVLKVKDEAKKKVKSREKDYLRPYVNAIIEYDNKHSDSSDSDSALSTQPKRLEYAMKFLSGEKPNGSKKKKK